MDIKFTPCESRSEYHAIMTIQLGELIEGGLFDWTNDKSLKWQPFSEEQYSRVCEKFVNRFYYREIGILPFKRWRLEYVRFFNEIMPKYNVLYHALADGANVLSANDQYGKKRHIYSDYPATMLSDNDDYASAGNDTQFETITQGDFIGKAREIAQSYNDIDVMILDDAEQLFSCLLSVNINGF